MKEGYKRYEFGYIPNEWNVKRIGEIYKDLKAGATPSRSNPEYFNGDIPWITSGELKSKFIYNTYEKISKEGLESANLRIYPKGTFFIAITGLEAEGTRGSCGINAIDSATNQSCLAFRKVKEVNTEYLYYWYLLYGDFIGLRYTQGTKQQSLNNKIVEGLEFAYPTLKEQEKIADILSTVDSQIDDTDKLIEKTKELKKGLMQRLLTKGIGHTEFKKTEVGEIPMGWEIKTVGELVNLLKSGLSRSLKEENIGIPCIRSNNIKDNRLILDDLKYWYEIDDKGANIEDYILKEGDIIINFINSISQIGKGCIFNKSNFRTIYTTNLLRIQVNEEKMTNKFFNYYTQTERYKKEIKLITKPAVNQASFTTIEYRAIKFPLPKLEEQQQISDILSSVDTKIEEYENKKIKLEALKKGLMQKLLTGKIRVI